MLPELDNRCPRNRCVYTEGRHLVRGSLQVTEEGDFFWVEASSGSGYESEKSWVVTNPCPEDPKCQKLPHKSVLLPSPGWGAAWERLGPGRTDFCGREARAWRSTSQTSALPVTVTWPQHFPGAGEEGCPPSSPSHAPVVPP